jgi:DNA mismatch repair protein MutL
LGQLAQTYILCEGKGELVVIDQHAAHERVMLHQLMKAPQAHLGTGKRFLTPAIVDLSPARAAALGAMSRPSPVSVSNLNLSVETASL